MARAVVIMDRPPGRRALDLVQQMGVCAARPHLSLGPSPMRWFFGPLYARTMLPDSSTPVLICSSWRESLAIEVRKKPFDPHPCGRHQTFSRPPPNKYLCSYACLKLDQSLSYLVACIAVLLAGGACQQVDPAKHMLHALCIGGSFLGKLVTFCAHALSSTAGSA